MDNCFCLQCPNIVNRVKIALRKENTRAWHEVQTDFNECEYQAVRDRQMRELELEDDVMSKVPIRLVCMICATLRI